MSLDLVAIAMTALAAAWDLKTKKIPNIITFPAMGLGLLLMTWQAGAKGLLDSLGGMLLAMALLFVFFALGVLGAGDVKLLAAVGALTGVKFVFYAFLYSAVAGGIIALILITIKGQFYPVMLNVFISIKNFLTLLIPYRGRHPLLPVNSGLRFPYGVAILAGMVLTYYMGW